MTPVASLDVIQSATHAWNFPPWSLPSLSTVKKLRIVLDLRVAEGFGAARLL